MQMAGFQAAGLDAEYFRIEIPKDDLAKAIPRLLEAGFQGWNCTLPHKTEMLRIVTQKDPSAIEAQSVNTVRVEGRQLHGFSTDAGGWEAAIQETWSVPLNNLQILILGCGGVGQSIARHLARAGCGSLTLMNRDPRRAEQLNLELKPIVDGRFPLSFLPWTDTNLEITLKKTDLIVQATSLGLRETDPLPIPIHLLDPKLKVYDTIYRKGFTPLIRAARERGCSAEDGLAMLLHQGILSWEIWTGKRAPKAAMRQALWQAAEREK
jgi:shikimate dehydrogenase